MLLFIAPERLTGNVNPTKRQKIDVYGFAVVLWQLKEMARPYASENFASAIRENVIAGVRPKISEDRSCQSGLVQLIRVCWSIDPDARPDFMHLLWLQTTLPVGQEVLVSEKH
ncbi:receptor-interacting serine/threonine-protein kinase 1-like [Corticium candelabrum]|uniref:receptor-interacting serine/threonine-protein kinase 1-like n=1 Tax=Corticium candelabrum TaxID=121492 RepID=UPI002E271E73|nr:receptor-interacting serine/threonine-protein kinase 1-like [Corticium candelabrum]